MRRDFPYTRLPGKRRGVVFSSTLWMGDDHLLLVRNHRFTESYRRFFYRDIQAVFVRRGPRFSIPVYWFVAFAVLLFALLVEAVAGAWRTMYATWAVLFLLVVWLVLESSEFRSCTTHIQTAVSREELNVLFRWREALKAVDLIREKVANAQADLPIPSAEVEPPVAVEIPALSPAAVPDSRPSRTASMLTLGSFVIVAIIGALTWYAGPRGVRDWVNVLVNLLGVVEAISLVSALVSLSRAKGVTGVRTLILVALVFVGVSLYGLAVMRQMQGMANFPQIGLTTLTTFRVALLRVDGIGSLILGITGIAFWRQTFPQSPR